MHRQADARISRSHHAELFCQRFKSRHAARLAGAQLLGNARRIARCAEHPTIAQRPARRLCAASVRRVMVSIHCHICHRRTSVRCQFKRSSGEAHGGARVAEQPRVRGKVQQRRPVERGEAVFVKRSLEPGRGHGRYADVSVSELEGGVRAAASPVLCHPGCVRCWGRGTSS